MTFQLRLAPLGGLPEFEAASLAHGVEVRATQLEPGDATVGYNLISFGDACLTAFTTTRAVAVEWPTPPDSLNFSVQVGSCPATFAGKERIAHSILIYRSVGAADWAARVGAVAPSGLPTISMSVPLNMARLLDLPMLERGPGWLQLPIPQETGEAFSRWAESLFVGDSISAADSSPRDQLYWWLRRMVHPVLDDEPVVESVSDYFNIVRKGNELADLQPNSSTSVVDIAESLDISVRTLQRAYQTVVGMRVSQYLRSRRLERARTLLRTEHVSVYRAAYANGFHHLPRFSQLFRNTYGTYPSEVAARRR